MIKDSGDRTEFSSGAVRDRKGGNGRCDLLPLAVIASIYKDDRYGVLTALDLLHSTGAIDPLVRACRMFCEGTAILNTHGEFGNMETAILELAIHFEEGAQKYEARNWEKGIPISSFVSSGIRHYLKYMRGDNDERHDRAFLWNMVCLLWTLENHSEMNDFTIKESES
jgi:hypothetical protein